MCFGVRDAIDLAFEHADAGALTILGDLVHNATVVDALRARGVAVERNVEQVRTPTVMVTAHGASERMPADLRTRRLQVVEATCPLVQVAHRAVSALVRDGYHPVIIGQRGHVEVRGLTEDLPAFDIVLDESDIEQLQPRSRIGVAAQTTQPIDRVRQLVEAIRRRFPESEVRFADTVCKPTKDRQTAATELARQSDIVIVVGGANSNNTRQLVITCGRYCSRVHQVQNAPDLRAEWFQAEDCVGLTAGTSTPDAVIDAIEGRIRELGAAHALAGHGATTGRGQRTR